MSTRSVNNNCNFLLITISSEISFPLTSKAVGIRIQVKVKFNLILLKCILDVYYFNTLQNNIAFVTSFLNRKECS
jgi:hypothetical protein